MEGSANNYAGAQPQRSVLSIKNAANVIKRKNSYHNQAVDLRVNIKQNSQQKQSLPSNAHVVPAKSKNVPNGLLRRATEGKQGQQKSIGNLSNYTHSVTRQGESGFNHLATMSHEDKREYDVQQPAIINEGQQSLSKTHTVSHMAATSVNATQAALIKMIQDKGNQSSGNLHQTSQS